MKSKLRCCLTAVTLLVVFGGAGLAVAETSGQEGKHQHGREQQQSVEKYVCPMHPQVVSDKPGSCPICKMDLEKVAGEAASHQHSSLSGHASVPVSEERRSLTGIRTSAVESSRFSRIIGMNGRVAYDPELYSAVREYQTAVSTAVVLGNDSQSGRALLEASKRRLELAGLSPEDLRQMPDAGALLSGGKGVWVYGEVYEHERHMLHTGQSVLVQASALPGHEFKAQLVSVSPVLDAKRRTFTVRALPEDPAELLKPNMFLSLKVISETMEALSVPEEALIRTGTRDIVYVDEGGSLSPRSVNVGMKQSGRYQILSGLAGGESVVSSAAFLVDSESRLLGAVSGMHGSH